MSADKRKGGGYYHIASHMHILSEDTPSTRVACGQLPPGDAADRADSNRRVTSVRNRPSVLQRLELRAIVLPLRLIALDYARYDRCLNKWKPATRAMNFFKGSRCEEM